MLLPAALGALLAVPAGRAEDWPQFGGRDGRNMVSPEARLPVSFDPGRPVGSPESIRNVRWIARLGGHAYGGPVVAGGKVFVGSNDRHLGDRRFQRTKGGMLRCFDARTGKLAWKLVIPRFPEELPGGNFDDMDVGVCSSAAVDGDRLYFVTNRAEVLCLDVDGLADGNDGPFRDEGAYMAGEGSPPAPPASGDADIIWRFDMIASVPCAPHDAASCSVLLHGDFLYACTANGVHRMSDQPMPMPLAPSLIVLNKNTGNLVAVDDEEIGTRLFHGQWSSPSLGKVGRKTLVFFGGGDGVCYAFRALTAKDVEAAGNEPLKLAKVWSYDCNPPDYKADDDGAPRDYWDGDGSFARITKDYKGPSEIIATPVFHDGRVYVAVGRDPLHGPARGVLHCIDAAKTGDITATGKVWTYDKVGRSMSTVSVADGLVYVADMAGMVHCVDAETGRACWVHDAGAEIWGATLVADGKVYVGTRKGTLLTLRHGRKPRLLATVSVGSAVCTAPVAANGALFVASHHHLFAVARELRPPGRRR